MELTEFHEQSQQTTPSALTCCQPSQPAPFLHQPWWICCYRQSWTEAPTRCGQDPDTKTTKFQHHSPQPAVNNTLIITLLTITQLGVLTWSNYMRVERRIAFDEILNPVAHQITNYLAQHCNLLILQKNCHFFYITVATATDNVTSWRYTPSSCMTTDSMCSTTSLVLLLWLYCGAVDVW